MKTAIQKSILALAVSGALLASLPAQAFVHTPADSFGSQFYLNEPVGRSLLVNAGTRWINVNQGETVNLVLSGQGEDRQVIWHFDGTAARMNLGDIVPGSNSAIGIYVNQNFNPMNDNAGE